MGSSTDARALAAALNDALLLVQRDAVHLAIAAGTLPGPEGIALSDRLREMAVANLRDVERLAARVTSLGGRPSMGFDAPVGRSPKAWSATVKRLLTDGQATLAALVEAIPADADDPEGEATEHLLEHMVNRKRSELEVLERALR